MSNITGREGARDEVCGSCAAYRRAVASQRSNSGFLTDFFTVGPHAGAHRVAVRAAVSVFVPLLVLVVLDRPQWTMFAAFGAFTSLYARGQQHARRAGEQIVVGSVLTVLVTAGTALSLMPQREVAVILGGTLVAGATSLLSDGMRWHPPGPLFPVFAFTAVTSLPHDPRNVPVAFAVAALAAAFSVVVSQVGRVRVESSRGGADGAKKVVLPRFDLAQVLSVEANRRRAMLFAGGALVAGLVGAVVGSLYGSTHAYWAMVAVVAGLTGATRRARLTRGLHRLIGTFAGVGLAALILPLYPRGVVAVLALTVLQAAAELFVGRNYGIALIFVTPLALLMGQLGHEVAVGPLLFDRAAETAVGCVVAMLLLYATRVRARQSGR